MPFSRRKTDPGQVWKSLNDWCDNQRSAAIAAFPIRQLVMSWCPICLEDAPHTLVQREPAVERAIGDPDLDRRTVEVVRCTNCGAAFVERDFPESLLERFYSRETASGIPATMEHFGWWLQNTEHAISELLDRIHHLSRGPLLDVGCGRGTLPYLARQRGWDCMGLDINAEMAKFVDSELGIPTLAKTIFFDGLPREHFAVITLFDVLEHIYAPVDVLRRCRELLRPDGVVIVKSPHGKMQLAKERLRYWLGRGSGNVANIGHINQFDRRSLDVAFRKAGLEPLRTYPAQVFLPAMRGAPPSFRRTLEFGAKRTLNSAMNAVHAGTGALLSFNLMALARKHSSAS